MSDVDRDAIVKRIRRMQAMTTDRGASEAEAMLAAEKVAALMAEYRLTQTDIEIGAEPVTERAVDRRQRTKEVSEDHCLRGIMRLCAVKCWFRTDADGVRRLVIFGPRAESDHAEWLYKMIGPTIMASAEGFKDAHRDDYPNMTYFRRAILDFRIGMARRINDRLIEMARALEPDAKTASGTALVVVRTALVDNAFAKLGYTFGKASTRNFRAGDAYARGAAAGEKVNLTRPLGATVPRGRLT
jgi:hypothetical protein